MYNVLQFLQNIMFSQYLVYFPLCIYVVNSLLQLILLYQYQFRFIMNTEVNINPNMAQYVFSGICLTTNNSIRNSRQLNNLRYLFHKILKHTQSRTRGCPIISGICLILNPSRYDRRGIRTSQFHNTLLSMSIQTHLYLHQFPTQFFQESDSQLNQEKITFTL